MADYLGTLRQRGIAKELAFPMIEYEERMRRTRLEMENREIDVLLVHHIPNICYLTGYQSPATESYTCLAVARAGNEVLQLVEHEIPGAELTSWIRDIRSFRWYQPEDIPALTASILGEINAEHRPCVVGLETQRIGFPISVYEYLRRSLPNVTFVDASDLVYGQRVVKSHREIAHLRESGRITAIGINAALDAIQPHCTDNEVAKAGYAAMIGAGSEYMSTQPFVAKGVMSSLIHTTFKRRKIEVGETVFLEFAASYQRYSAPMMRSAVVGTPSPTIARLAGAVRTTLDLLLENIRGGRTAHDIATAASKGLSPVRDEIYFQGAYAYHVGLSLPPNWWEGLSPFIAEGIDEELRPGMVFHMPIAARIPGLCGVALSETVVVTELGCDILTSPTREFRVIPT
jgi:Xaa-Pro aminopeptidase